jgi:hypothetical protein
MMQFSQMALSRIFPLLLVVGFAGCSNADGEAVSEVTTDKRLDQASTDPGYGTQRQIAGPFRFQFEESSIELCSSSVTPEAPACTGDSQRCWLEFDNNANKDMDVITKQRAIGEEGTYWIEGVGRMATKDGGFGHLNAYECQVEMIKVSRFVKIAG